MRPRAVTNFERLFLASFALGLIQHIASWRAERAMTSLGTLVFALVFGNLVVLAMVLFTSRGRSQLAKWLIVIATIAVLPFYVKNLLSGASLGFPVISWLQAAMQLTALGLLFTSSARSWLRSKPDSQIATVNAP